MEQWLLDYQLWLKFGIFSLILAAFAWWETAYTWRPWVISRKQRWANHLSLALLSQLCLRALFPFLALGLAMHVQDQKMGFLNQTDWPLTIQIIIGVIALDFVMYLLHRMLHKFKWLWRIHQVHHMDRQIDVTTGLRFHPLEEILMMAAKIIGIAFFGVPMLAVFIFELLLNTATLFTHINVRFKPTTDKFLRKCIVTPGMHRIHHSDTPYETNSNYGFCFSWWDKLFGTYVATSRTGERQLVIGLEKYHSPIYQTLENMLLMPFNIKKLRPKIQKIKKRSFRTEDKNIPNSYIEHNDLYK
jgi:sterol desaturase/sphingolipid hydroxylase (fatty acid hydroxylase superfamily)